MGFQASICFKLIVMKYRLVMGNNYKNIKIIAELLKKKQIRGNISTTISICSLIHGQRLFNDRFNRYESCSY